MTAEPLNPAKASFGVTNPVMPNKTSTSRATRSALSQLLTNRMVANTVIISVMIAAVVTNPLYRLTN